MLRAKLFRNGGSQAVRLPKGCRFEGDEVYVKQVGQAVVLIPVRGAWQTLLDGLDMFTEDFLADRAQAAIQARPMLD